MAGMSLGLRCSGCHRPLADSDVVCPACRFPAEKAPAAGSPLPSTTANTDADADGRDPVASDVTERIVCEHEQARPGSVVCPSCGAALGAQAGGAPVGDGSAAATRGVRVRTAWGDEVRLAPGESLEIGRDVGPFSQQLSTITTVSRRHATLSVSISGVVMVVDHGSTNGTFVNGRPCSSTGPTEVPVGASVSFSSAFALIVEPEAA